jgi:hypothetical protein
MLMVTFYPLIDGGIEQMTQVYRGVFGTNRSASGKDVDHSDSDGVLPSDSKRDDRHQRRASVKEISVESRRG